MAEICVGGWFRGLFSEDIDVLEAAKDWQGMGMMDRHDSTRAKGIVIAVDAAGNVFAVESADGVCAVFARQSGPAICAGDLLEGALLDAGQQDLKHGEGVCTAVGHSGPITRQRALALVRNPQGLHSS